MKVLVCGGRDFPDYKYVCRVLDIIHADRQFSLVVHGDAGKYKQGYRPSPIAVAGADALAGRWCEDRGVQQVKVPANWTGLDRRAGMVRNRLMLELIKPELCVGFPGGWGTANMMHLSSKAGVEVIDTDDIL